MLINNNQEILTGEKFPNFFLHMFYERIINVITAIKIIAPIIVHPSLKLNFVFVSAGLIVIVDSNVLKSVVKIFDKLFVI